ncbi:MAG TPA: TonB family protein [Candidatus Sulfotelmatobacter sp.]|nr:TonB family protein [Candidatus Sulfotelmatobacter sp.]
MSFAGPISGMAQSEPLPRLLVELPSRPAVFISNLRDHLFPRRLAPLELRSAPGEFWPDVFVNRPLPWSRFFQSTIYHGIAAAILVGLGHLFAMQPRIVVVQPTFDHSQVVYYQAAEYLPPLDTRPQSPSPAVKADPEFSKQPIISVPPEADNPEQTIVAPPKIRLKRNIALPNVVAWADTAQKPQLAIPDSPLTPAADITRLAPKLDSSVVAPSPDAARLAHRRNSPELQNSVVAPPPDLQASNAHAAIPGLQPELIAPPPAVDTASVRRLGDMNIAPSSVIAPAPQLPVAAQRTLPGGGLTASAAQQVIAPPPSLAASGSAAGASAGSPGRLIALNLHPTVGAPPDPPAGNRRGSFAATPEGRSGASGSPGSAGGNTTSGAGSHGSAPTGSGTSSGAKTNLPSGLYVGTPPAKPAATAGDPAAKPSVDSVNPNLIASVRPPRVTSARPMQPDSSAKLTEPERALFNGRKFYSVTLNMPNLNSGGGSWVIRFAELNHESTPHDANAPAPDLSQPMATRKVDPAYPLQLMRQNVTGTVILYAVIHADGSVGNVRVLRGVDERLDHFASDAVAQWKFDPATKNGVPVEVEATFQIPFKPTRFGTNF